MMEYHEGSNNFFAEANVCTNEWLVEEIIDEQLFQPVHFLLIVTLWPTIDTIVMKFQSQCNQFDKSPAGDLRFDSIVPRSYRSLSNSKACTMYDF